MSTAKLPRAAALVVALALALGAGFAAGYETARPAAAAPAPTAAAPTLQSQFGLFWEVWQVVDSEFYDRAALDYRKLTYGAIGGMLAALGDSHTSFSTPTVAQISNQDLSGSFDGVGLELGVRDGQLTIVAPIAGSPGERAGLRAGDVILRIDDVEAASLSQTDAVARIRGPRGSTVRLVVSREGVSDPLVFDVVRAEIHPTNVSGKMLDGAIGYVRLSSFTATSGQEVKNVLDGLLQNKPQALVLDLRNDPGGMLLSSVDVASQFLKEGVVLYEQRQDEVPQAYRAKPNGVATRIPLAVLINRGSASAAEIVAGALQDNGRAVLVGENSFGKDSVQNVHQLSDGSSVRVTFARWFTPKRQAIGQKGLTPDIVVPLTEEDARLGRDPQLDRAVQYLTEKIAEPVAVSGAR